MKFVIAGIDVSINFDLMIGKVTAQIVIPQGGDKYTDIHVTVSSKDFEQIKIAIHEAEFNKG